MQVMNLLSHVHIKLERMFPCNEYVWLRSVKDRRFIDTLNTNCSEILTTMFQLCRRFGGLILDRVVNFYGFVIFQPIINGIGGNLVSIQASRISTKLHQTSIMGILPPRSKMWVSPWTALFRGCKWYNDARITNVAATYFSHFHQLHNPPFAFVRSSVRENCQNTHLHGGGRRTDLHFHRRLHETQSSLATRVLCDLIPHGGCISGEHDDSESCELKARRVISERSWSGPWTINE